MDIFFFIIALLAGFVITTFPRAVFGKLDTRWGGTKWEQIECKIIKCLQPFLVRDRLNNLALLMFILSVGFPTCFELNRVVESLMLSVAAACIFHFFIIIPTNERKKHAQSTAVRRLFFDLLLTDRMFLSYMGMDDFYTGVNDMSDSELLELDRQIDKKQGSPIGDIGEIEDYSLMRFLEKSFCLDDITPELTFKELSARIIESDYIVLGEIEKCDLSCFPELADTIENFSFKVKRIRSPYFEGDATYSKYIYAKHLLLAEFTNTAGVYLKHYFDPRFRYYTRQDKGQDFKSSSF